MRIKDQLRDLPTLSAFSVSSFLSLAVFSLSAAVCVQFTLMVSMTSRNLWNRIHRNWDYRIIILPDVDLAFHFRKWQQLPVGRVATPAELSSMKIVS
jgi:hypothetical protein